MVELEEDADYHLLAESETCSDEERDYRTNKLSRMLSLSVTLVEWLSCLLWDVLLLAMESAANIWIATEMYNYWQGVVVIISLVLPSLINSMTLISVGLPFNAKERTVLVMLLLLFGFPSPIMIYIWQLTRFSCLSSHNKDKLRLLSNTFRMTQAVGMSLPLVLMNLYTLTIQLKSVYKETPIMDFTVFQDQPELVKLHGWAFIFSITNLVRASCLFNERTSSCTLFFMIALPFTLVSTLTRIMMLSVILSFVTLPIAVLLLSGLIFLNTILYSLTQYNRNLIVISNTLPKTVVMSLSSIISPCGYTNDAKSFHLRLKGGLFVTLNYIFIMTILGSILGYLIAAQVPNTFQLFSFPQELVSEQLHNGLVGSVQGISIPQKDTIDRMPFHNMTTNLAGLDLSLEANVKIVDGEQIKVLSAFLQTDNADATNAITVPIILAAICLPFVIMRVAMTELDFFIAYQKQYLVRCNGNLKDLVLENTTSSELTARLNVTIVCFYLGLVIVTGLLISVCIVVYFDFVNVIA